MQFAVQNSANWLSLGRNQWQGDLWRATHSATCLSVAQASSILSFSDNHLVVPAQLLLPKQDP